MPAKRQSNALLDFARRTGGGNTYGSMAEMLPTADELDMLHAQQRQQWNEPEAGYFAHASDVFGQQQYYDQLAALRADSQRGFDPESGTMHGSSQFKDDAHPNRFVYDREMGGILDSKNNKRWRYQPGSQDTNYVLNNLLKRLSEQ